MGYFIRWLTREGSLASPPMRFLLLTEAMDFASAVLAGKAQDLWPKDIWIEDDKGWHVSDKDAIARHAQRMGPAQRGRRE